MYRVELFVNVALNRIKNMHIYLLLTEWQKKWASVVLHCSKKQTLQWRPRKLKTQVMKHEINYLILSN